MNFRIINNQKGFGFGDVVFWVLLAVFGTWLYHQYVLHPEGLNSRPVNHSAYEDKK